MRCVTNFHIYAVFAFTDRNTVQSTSLLTSEHSEAHCNDSVKDAGSAVPPAAQDIRSATTGSSDAEPEARAYSAQDMALRAALVRMAKAVEVDKIAGGKKCAVVSSSADLLDHKDGGTIDEYDVVARINFPVLHGYHEFVGSKTSIVISGWPPFTAPAEGGAEPKYLDRGRSTDYKNGTHVVIADMECATREAVGDLMRRNGFADPAHLSLPKCLRATKECEKRGFACAQIPPGELSAFLQKSYIPSTGFIGVNLLSVSCKCVKLFGFDANKVSNAEYWKKDKDVREWHQFDKEHADLQKMSNKC